MPRTKKRHVPLSAILKNPRTKLNPAKAKTIVRLKGRGWNGNALAERYNISRSHALNVAAQRFWAGYY